MQEAKWFSLRYSFLLQEVFSFMQEVTWSSLTWSFYTGSGRFDAGRDMD